MCRIDLCGQIGVKISSYGDRKFIKINPLIRPWGRIIPREDISALELSTLKMAKKIYFFFLSTFFFQPSSMEIALLGWKYHYMDDFRR